MSRALLALVIGLAVGNPLVQWLAGVGGSPKAGPLGALILEKTLPCRGL
jgi:hypothetical protein